MGQLKGYLAERCHKQGGPISFIKEDSLKSGWRNYNESMYKTKYSTLIVTWPDNLRKSHDFSNKWMVLNKSHNT